MAVNLTVVFANADFRVVDIEATADADTTATIPHGLGAIPEDIVITGLANAAAISLWRATTRDATNVVLTKSTTAGSGAAGIQVRAYIRKLNSVWPLAPVRL